MARLGNVDQTIDYEWLGYHDFNGGYKVEAAEEARFYNTADETTAYERGFARWATNRWEIGVEAGVGGVQRAMRLMYGTSVMMDGSSARPSFPNGITFTGDSLFTNNIALNFGNVYSSIMWGTAQISDALMVGIACNVGGDPQSGNIIVCEHADRTVDFGHAANLDPHLFLHSADATTTTDWLGLWCDQTGNGHVEVGGNGLIIGSAAKGLGFYGGAPAAQSTGWAVTNVTPTKTFDADAVTLNVLADVTGTLIDLIKTLGLAAA